jgi:hypothetical protein
MAQAIDQPFTLMHGHFSAGIPYLARGDIARAMPPFERAPPFRATDVHLWLGEITADLGLTYALSGRIDDALPVLGFGLTGHDVLAGEGGGGAESVSVKSSAESTAASGGNRPSLCLIVPNPGSRESTLDHSGLR